MCIRSSADGGTDASPSDVAALLLPGRGGRCDRASRTGARPRRRVDDTRNRLDGVARHAGHRDPDALTGASLRGRDVRRGAVTEPVAGWRHLAFIIGLAMVFLALQLPIDPLVEHLFLVHQLQHLFQIQLNQQLHFLQ